MALITDNEMRMKKNKIVYVFIIAVLVIGIPIQVFPFVWLISSSLKGAKDIFELPPRLIPKTFFFQNYAEVLNTLPLHRYFLNTFLVAILTILIQCTISTLAAFSLSKIRPKGGRLILLFFLGTMMIPEQALLIPTYLTLRRFPLTGWNFINTVWGVVLPWSAWAWPIFLLKGFFDGLPAELFDAAKIDGASNITLNNCSSVKTNYCHCDFADIFSCISAVCISVDNDAGFQVMDYNSCHIQYAAQRQFRMASDNGTVSVCHYTDAAGVHIRSEVFGTGD